jgi:hypothetical protein
LFWVFKKLMPAAFSRMLGAPTGTGRPQRKRRR